MPNKTFARMLVAETDEDGVVTFVWIKRQRSKYAHPVREAREVARQFAEFEVHGASAEDTLGWLNARTEAV